MRNAKHRSSAQMFLGHGNAILPSPALAGEGGPKGRVRAVVIPKTLTPALSRKSGRGGFRARVSSLACDVLSFCARSDAPIDGDRHDVAAGRNAGARCEPGDGGTVLL